MHGIICGPIYQHRGNTCYSRLVYIVSMNPMLFVDWYCYDASFRSIVRMHNSSSTHPKPTWHRSKQ